MAEAIGKLCDLYGGSEIVELPGGPLELKDFSRIHGSSLLDRLNSFFPRLPGEIEGTLLYELTRSGAQTVMRGA
jgi:hypothetical protein